MDENNTIFCPNCGMKNDYGDMFCGNCGTKLEVRIEEPQPVAPVSQNYNAGNQVSDPEAGKGPATASLVLGIISVVCWFFGYGAIISVLLGFIGLILAGKAKEAGCESGVRTAGFVLSLIGLIGGGVVLIACVACVGSLGMLGASMY